MFCCNCGKEILDDAKFCPYCGAKVGEPKTEKAKVQYIEVKAKKSIGIAALLCILLGGFGIHRFYLDRVGSGILMFIIGMLGFATSGVMFIITIPWAIIDLLIILRGGFGLSEKNKINSNKIQVCNPSSNTSELEKIVIPGENFEEEPKELINARELINEIRMNGTSDVHCSKKLLKGLVMIAKEHDWEKQIDPETLSILSDLNIKRLEMLKTKKISRSDVQIKIDKENSRVNEKDCDYEPLYDNISYLYNPEEGTIELDESNNSFVDETVSSDYSNFRDYDNKLFNDYNKKIENVKALIRNEEFDKIIVLPLESSEPAVIKHHYFYLLGLYKTLYEYRYNELALKILVNINDFLSSNLDFFKIFLKEYEYIRIKVNNEYFHEHKTDKQIDKEAEMNISKINFEDIVENKKILECLKNQSR